MQPCGFCTVRASLPTICIFGGLLVLAGCAGTGAPGPSLLDNLLGNSTSVAAPAPEPDKGCGTPAECRSALKTMIDDPKRGWVGQPQPPETYANGMRLFAYRALRKRLNCSELSLAVDEMRAASKALSGPVAGMSPDQISRTRALNSQVESELVKERTRRCRA